MKASTLRCSLRFQQMMSFGFELRIEVALTLGLFLSLESLVPLYSKVHLLDQVHHFFL